MSYYTSIVPAELVERLYEVGCPNIGRYEEANGSVKYSEATYADIFDGLIEKGLCIAVRKWVDSNWDAEIRGINDNTLRKYIIPRTIWHEVANAAIERAIEILKVKKKYEQDKIPTVQ